MLVVDPRHVRGGSVAVREGQAQPFYEGEDGDLWRQLGPLEPIVCWVPSHQTFPAAKARGVQECDWLGNHIVDAHAKDAAMALMPAAELIASRTAALDALAVAQAVIAHVEEAVMCTDYAQAKHRVRKRIATGLFQSRKPKRSHSSRPLVREPVAPAEAPPTLHDLVPLAGPVPRTVAAATRTTVVAWPATCAKCGKRSGNTGKWLALLHSACGDQTPEPQRLYGHHELERVVGGWRCRRCGLPCTSARSAAAARAPCKVPTVLRDGTRDEAAERWLASKQQLPTAWKAAHCRPTAADLARVPVPVAAAPVAPAPGPPRPVGLRWKNHLAVRNSHASAYVCLACG